MVCYTKKTKLKSHNTMVFQFVLLAAHWHRTLAALPDDMDHMGMGQTLSLVQDRFFWPRMNESMRKHIQSCDRCMKFKQVLERAKMYPIETSYPLELIHMDFLTIGRVDSNDVVNILVITDHFTKYAQAYATPNQTAKVVAKTLWENFLVHYGWPTKILMDQGKTFESSLIKELCSITLIRKIRTTSYRPQTNGTCERFNHTLINMLGTLPIKLKKNWQEWVSTLTHAYNCMVSNATGFKPYFLMYG